jgi:hypothetical protein
MRRARWCRDHRGWVEIPYKYGKDHVIKGEGRNNLEFLDFRWGVEKGDLGNGLGDCLPNWDSPLERGKIWDKWCAGVLREFLR